MQHRRNGAMDWCVELIKMSGVRIQLLSNYRFKSSTLSRAISATSGSVSPNKGAMIAMALLSPLSARK